MPAGYSATIHCGPTREAPQPYTGGPFPVTSPPVDGATLTCTITNIQLFSTVRVVKAWIGDPASATIFVDQNGAAPFDASTVATATRDSASFVYPVNTPVTVGEVEVPAGYSASIHCGPTLELPQPYNGGPFPVTSRSKVDDGRLYDHQHAAALDRAHGQGMGWRCFLGDALRRREGDIAYDASTVATACGQDASFSTRSRHGRGRRGPGAARFTAAIDCGGGPHAYAGGPFPVASPAVDSATVACTITNTPVTTVRVLKEWGGAARSATIFVDDVGRAPLDVASVTTADRHSVSFDYPPSNQVTIGEIRVPRATCHRQLRHRPARPPPLPGKPVHRHYAERPRRSPHVHGHNVQRPGPLGVLVLDKRWTGISCIPRSA